VPQAARAANTAGAPTHGFSLAALLDEYGDVVTASGAFEATRAADARQRWRTSTH
jgi:hypothetical protein